jgi:S1-C subfamily serine protease
LKEANKELFASSEKARKDAEKKITALQSEVTSTQSGLDLSTIIKDWRPFIAKVKCSWYTATTGYTGTGSALLFKTNAKPYAHLVTNKHVVSYKEKKSEECTITFPDTKDVIEVSDNSISLSAKGLDFGMIDIASQSAYIDALANQTSSRSICLSATVGEKVVILGYPSIGTKDDITATEGIISGIDGDYYITSAKVEQGNSGGAAILVRNGGKSCYLGIPTFTNVGQIEALARILSAKVLQ